MKSLTAVPTATAWRHHDYATPRFLKKQSMRHSDELSPWIIAVIWLSGLGLTAMSVVGLVVSVQWLWAHWLH